MKLTPYHAKYFAHELTKRCSSDSMEKLAGAVDSELEAITHRRQVEIQRTISERNAQFFTAEADKLDGWADDLKLGLEREIKEIDRQIKEARRAATAALTLEEKLAAQKQIKALESQRNAKRRTLFDAQDEIDNRREQLIAEIEGKLQQKTVLTELFSIAWTLVKGHGPSSVRSA